MSLFQIPLYVIIALHIVGIGASVLAHAVGQAPECEDRSPVVCYGPFNTILDAGVEGSNPGNISGAVAAVQGVYGFFALDYPLYNSGPEFLQTIGLLIRIVLAIGQILAVVYVGFQAFGRIL